jgi:hypothetical protein
MLARDAIAFITLSACVSSGLVMRESAEYSAGRIDFLLKTNLIKLFCAGG